MFVILVSLIVIVLASGCVREDDLTADQRTYQLSQQLMCPRLRRTNS